MDGDPGRGTDPDHPRSRGVYPTRTATRRGRWWIIPARAGFTSTNPLERDPGRDHPRSRGVYHARVTITGARAGSSPLARGLLRPSAVAAVTAGIIPARAGFTALRVGRPGPPGDHPRSRGVYRQGHSPGAHDRRIIPARAGFTARAAWIEACFQGSSPLARGLRRRSRRRRSAARDHPRSRGVYPRFNDVVGDLPGSSPLARGLPWEGLRRLANDRIIPARAGFTRPGQLG